MSPPVKTESFHIVGQHFEDSVCDCFLGNLWVSPVQGNQVVQVVPAEQYDHQGDQDLLFEADDPVDILEINFHAYKPDGDVTISAVQLVNGRQKVVIIKMVEGMDNKELYDIEWHGKYPFGRMVQFNTSSPYKNARGRIRNWKKEKGLL